MLNLKSIILLIILAHTVSYAQFRVSLQAGSVVPTGYFEDAAEVGYGLFVSLNYLPINPYLEFTLSTGYMHCGYKENLPEYTFKFSSVPVLLGVRYNFTDYDFIPYLGLEGGLYLPEYQVNIDYGYLGNESVKTRETSWGIVPYTGFRINVNDRIDVDVSAKYNRINTKYIARSFLLISAGFDLRF